MDCTGIQGAAALQQQPILPLPKAQSAPSAPDVGIRQDSIAISEEAKAFAAKQTSGTMDASMQDDLKAQMKQSEDEGSAYQTYIKCMRIALRIMNGDEVPEEDRKFLMDNEPELYAKAITLRMEKEDPEEYDSLLTEEDLADPEAKETPLDAATEPPESDAAADALPVGEPEGEA